VPHGAGVPSIDGPEAGALRQVFGDRLARIPLVTLIPFIGECMSGAGGLQVAAGAMCLKEQRLPARLNAGVPAGELNAGACESVPADLSRVLVCSGSLGGQNAALVLGRVS
jgi:3-oxoacyl-[acyl-carrier-protein] synthase II